MGSYCYIIGVKGHHNLPRVLKPKSRIAKSIELQLYQSNC